MVRLLSQYSCDVLHIYKHGIKVHSDVPELRQVGSEYGIIAFKDTVTSVVVVPSLCLFFFLSLLSHYCT